MLDLENLSMYIHFAFAQLGKEGRIKEQCDEFIDKILNQKRLKISKCKEFIPVPDNSNENTITLDLTKGKVEGSSFILDTRNTTEAPGINYLPVDVPMICFIDIPFKKLKNCAHKDEYGKLGITFKNEYYEKHKLKHVIYYDEKMVFKDALIQKWHRENSVLSEDERKRLEKEITLYRKPKKLTENFLKSVVATISNSKELSFFTYDRYPLGYDFTLESECRIAFEVDEDYLAFDEDDIFVVIVPNRDIEKLLRDYFKSGWSSVPDIRVFPE